MEHLKNINSICEEYRIRDYSINSDGTIDIEGSVNLSHRKLKKLPLQFRNINGDFICCYNELISLEGCPEKVYGNFDCSNNKLTTLKGGPKEADDHFDCSYNKLTTLSGCPENIKSLSCYRNPIDKYWYKVNDVKKLELFLYMDIDVNDDDDICQEKLNYINETY